MRVISSLIQRTLNNWTDLSFFRKGKCGGRRKTKTDGTSEESAAS